MRVVMVAIALALMLPVCAEAGGRSGGRSHASSGGRPHSSPQHHHYHHQHGTTVFVGGGFYYYGYPAYYSPYPYGVPLYPPMPADPYWYYCRAANAYYPYVQVCPGGWERYLPGTPLG